MSGATKCACVRGNPDGNDKTWLAAMRPLDDTRAINCLANAAMRGLVVGCIHDFANVSVADLHKVKNMGRVSIDKIRRAAATVGVRLLGDDGPIAETIDELRAQLAAARADLDAATEKAQRMWSIAMARDGQVAGLLAAGEAVAVRLRMAPHAEWNATKCPDCAALVAWNVESLRAAPRAETKG